MSKPTWTWSVLAPMNSDDLFALQCAVENLRAPERTESIIEAGWSLAYKLEQIAKRIDAIQRHDAPQQKDDNCAKSVPEDWFGHKNLL